MIACVLLMLLQQLWWMTEAGMSTPVCGDAKARMRLQGTKACLGWDRGDAPGGYHAPTHTVDAWLQLLQQAERAAAALRPVPGTLGREATSAAIAFLALVHQLLEHWKVCPSR